MLHRPFRSALHTEKKSLRHQSLTCLIPPRHYASSSITSNPSIPVKSWPSTQPRSWKAATSRKTYLHRIYLSLIRSSPVCLLLLHGGVTAHEWMAIRRELKSALTKLDLRNQDKPPLAQLIKISIIQAPIFSVALRVADYDPESVEAAADGELIPFTHGTSKEAYKTTKPLQRTHPLAHVLTGPVAVVSFPSISPDHVTTTMDVLFPEKLILKKGADPVVFSGLQKLILLGARVKERQSGMSRTLDKQGIKCVTGLKDLETIRGEIVAILRSVGGGELVRSLESVSVGLGRVLEGRRKMMEEEVSATAKTEG